MNDDIIFDEDGFTRAYTSPDVEFINPINHYRNFYFHMIKTEIKDLLFMKNYFLASQLDESFFEKKADVEWRKKLNEINQTVVPSAFIDLLSTKYKSEQIRILKGASLNPDQLIALIFKAWTDFGYTFSEYSAEHHHKGLDVKELPTLINIENGDVKKVGMTTLTDGQLKNVIEHRKVIIAKFFDNEDSWHCLFVTYNSLASKENWQGGKPHYHYISDKFGVPRDEVIARIKDGNYVSTPVHIAFNDYDF